MAKGGDRICGPGVGKCSHVTEAPAILSRSCYSPSVFDHCPATALYSARAIPVIVPHSLTQPMLTFP